MQTPESRSKTDSNNRSVANAAPVLSPSSSPPLSHTRVISRSCNNLSGLSTAETKSSILDSSDRVRLNANIALHHDAETNPHVALVNPNPEQGLKSDGSAFASPILPLSPPHTVSETNRNSGSDCSVPQPTATATSTPLSASTPKMNMKSPVITDKPTGSTILISPPSQVNQQSSTQAHSSLVSIATMIDRTEKPNFQQLSSVSKEMGSLMLGPQIRHEMNGNHSSILPRPGQGMSDTVAVSPDSDSTNASTRTNRARSEAYITTQLSHIPDSPEIQLKIRKSTEKGNYFMSSSPHDGKEDNHEFSSPRRKFSQDTSGRRPSHSQSPRRASTSTSLDVSALSSSRSPSEYSGEKNCGELNLHRTSFSPASPMDEKMGTDELGAVDRYLTDSAVYTMTLMNNREDGERCGGTSSLSCLSVSSPMGNTLITSKAKDNGLVAPSPALAPYEMRYSSTWDLDYDLACQQKAAQLQNAKHARKLLHGMGMKQSTRSTQISQGTQTAHTSQTTQMSRHASRPTRYHSTHQAATNVAATASENENENESSEFYEDEDEDEDDTTYENVDECYEDGYDEDFEDFEDYEDYLEEHTKETEIEAEEYLVEKKKESKKSSSLASSNDSSCFVNHLLHNKLNTLGQGYTDLEAVPDEKLFRELVTGCDSKADTVSGKNTDLCIPHVNARGPSKKIYMPTMGDSTSIASPAVTNASTTGTNAGPFVYTYSYADETQSIAASTCGSADCGDVDLDADDKDCLRDNYSLSSRFDQFGNKRGEGDEGDEGDEDDMETTHQDSGIGGVENGEPRMQKRGISSSSASRPTSLQSKYAYSHHVDSKNENDKRGSKGHSEKPEKRPLSELEKSDLNAETDVGSAYYASSLSLSFSPILEESISTSQKDRSAATSSRGDDAIDRVNSISPSGSGSGSGSGGRSSNTIPTPTSSSVPGIPSVDIGNDENNANGNGSVGVYGNDFSIAYSPLTPSLHSMASPSFKHASSGFSDDEVAESIFPQMFGNAFPDDAESDLMHQKHQEQQQQLKQQRLMKQQFKQAQALARAQQQQQQQMQQFLHPIHQDVVSPYRSGANEGASPLADMGGNSVVKSIPASAPVPLSLPLTVPPVSINLNPHGGLDGFESAHVQRLPPTRAGRKGGRLTQGIRQRSKRHETSNLNVGASIINLSIHDREHREHYLPVSSSEPVSINVTGLGFISSHAGEDQNNVKVEDDDVKSSLLSRRSRKHRQQNTRRAPHHTHDLEKSHFAESEKVSVSDPFLLQQQMQFHMQQQANQQMQMMQMQTAQLQQLQHMQQLQQAQQQQIQNSYMMQSTLHLMEAKKLELQSLHAAYNQFASSQQALSTSLSQCQAQLSQMAQITQLPPVEFFSQPISRFSSISKPVVMPTHTPLRSASETRTNTRRPTPQADPGSDVERIISTSSRPRKVTKKKSTRDSKSQSSPRHRERSSGSTRSRQPKASSEVRHTISHSLSPVDGARESNSILSPTLSYSAFSPNPEAIADPIQSIQPELPDVPESSKISSANKSIKKDTRIDIETKAMAKQNTSEKDTTPSDPVESPTESEMGIDDRLESQLPVTASGPTFIDAGEKSSSISSLFSPHIERELAHSVLSQQFPLLHDQDGENGEDDGEVVESSVTEAEGLYSHRSHGSRGSHGSQRVKVAAQSCSNSSGRSQKSRSSRRMSRKETEFVSDNSSQTYTFQVPSQPQSSHSSSLQQQMQTYMQQMQHQQMQHQQLQQQLQQHQHGISLPFSSSSSSSPSLLGHYNVLSAQHAGSSTPLPLSAPMTEIDTLSPPISILPPARHTHAHAHAQYSRYSNPSHTYSHSSAPSPLLPATAVLSLPGLNHGSASTLSSSAVSIHTPAVGAPQHHSTVSTSIAPFRTPALASSLPDHFASSHPSQMPIQGLSHPLPQSQTQTQTQGVVNQARPSGHISHSNSHHPSLDSKVVSASLLTLGKFILDPSQTTVEGLTTTVVETKAMTPSIPGPGFGFTSTPSPSTSATTAVRPNEPKPSDTTSVPIATHTAPVASTSVSTPVSAPASATPAPATGPLAESTWDTLKVGLDIGGTLTKICYFSPYKVRAGFERSKARLDEFVLGSIKYGNTGFRSRELEVNLEPGLGLGLGATSEGSASTATANTHNDSSNTTTGVHVPVPATGSSGVVSHRSHSFNGGTFHFIKFESAQLSSFLRLVLGEGFGPVEVYATGGGGVKHRKIIEDQLNRMRLRGMVFIRDQMLLLRLAVAQRLSASGYVVSDALLSLYDEVEKVLVSPKSALEIATKSFSAPNMATNPVSGMEKDLFEGEGEHTALFPLDEGRHGHHAHAHAHALGHGHNGIISAQDIQTRYDIRNAFHERVNRIFARFLLLEADISAETGEKSGKNGKKDKSLTFTSSASSSPTLSPSSHIRPSTTRRTLRRSDTELSIRPFPSLQGHEQWSEDEASEYNALEAEANGSNAPVQYKIVDEMQALVKGVDFLVRYCPGECYSFKRYLFHEELEMHSRAPPSFPFLLVNIGSGVSILKVDSGSQYTRVGGSSLGGGTFYGLCRALTGCTSFSSALSMAHMGKGSKVDLLVADIYGRDFSSLGLSGDTIAASFGKLVKPKAKARVSDNDLAKAALVMITNNICSLAHLYARQVLRVPSVVFVGNFLRNNLLAMRMLAYALTYWSSGSIEAIFLRHEGYFGAVGSFMKDTPLPSSSTIGGEAATAQLPQPQPQPAPSAPASTSMSVPVSVPSSTLPGEIATASPSIAATNTISQHQNTPIASSSIVIPSTREHSMDSDYENDLGDDSDDDENDKQEKNSSTADVLEFEL